jgi:hypothetical protein
MTNNVYSIIFCRSYSTLDFYNTNTFVVDAQQTSSTGRGRLEIGDSRAAVGGTWNDSASQLAYMPPAVTSPVIHDYSANINTPNPWGFVAGPSMNNPHIIDFDSLVVPQHSQAPVGTSQQVQRLTVDLLS